MATLGPGNSGRPTIRVIVLGHNRPARESSLENLAETLADPEACAWIDILRSEGSRDEPELEKLFREVFAFHPLAIEDALVDTHLPKADDWEKYLYLCCQGADYSAQAGLKLRELDAFLGPNYLITLRSEPSSNIDRIAKTLFQTDAPNRRSGPDHLLYMILDGLADEFLRVIDGLDEAIDAVQDQVLAGPTRKTLQTILKLKRSALSLQRLLVPQREVLNRLARDVYPVVRAENRVYFRDVYDHHVRIHQSAETLRDLITSALDTYLSAISNRTNDVMKVLTIVTVLFLPMNTIVGFFGMNFFGDNIAVPWHPSKSIVFWTTMAAMAITPFLAAYWLKRKGWF